MTDERRNSGPTLDDVLDRYSDDNPSRESLEKWANEYPQFRRELMDLTVSWLELRHLRPVAATSDPIDARVRAASVLGQVLYTLQASSELSNGSVASGEIMPADVANPMSQSLLDRAKVLGMNVDQIASAASMSVAMVTSFHRRLVNAASVPVEALESLSSVLKVSVEWLLEYLKARPQLSPSQQYKAQQTPKVNAKIDFIDLVKNDPELPHSGRDRWLSISSADTSKTTLS